MTKIDRTEITAAMKRPLLLDTESGVYWDFDFEKEEFRVGTACNAGLLVDFTVKYDEGERLYDQVYRLVEKAKEYYNEGNQGGSED